MCVYVHAHTVRLVGKGTVEDEIPAVFTPNPSSSHRGLPYTSGHQQELCPCLILGRHRGPASLPRRRFKRKASIRELLGERHRGEADKGAAGSRPWHMPSGPSSGDREDTGSLRCPHQLRPPWLTPWHPESACVDRSAWPVGDV